MNRLIVNTSFNAAICFSWINFLKLPSYLAILSRLCFCQERLDQMMLEFLSNLVFYDSIWITSGGKNHFYKSDVSLYCCGRG